MRNAEYEGGIAQRFLRRKGWWVPPRSQDRELLDAEVIPVRDLQGNLDDLRWLNRYLGSHWIICTTVHRVWQGLGSPPRLRLLDVGTGAADIPVALQHWAQRQGVQLTVVAVDNHQGVIEYARSAVPLAAIALVRATGLYLPFRPRTFDVVMCSTMLHHLDWQQGITLLQGLAMVTRHSVIVNDLRRSWLHYGGAWLYLSAFARNRLTRHDGPLSVLRAYRVDEVRQMASAAGLHGARVSTVLGYRWLLTYTLPE
jgi:2-polyprenyl-3-methyl-5-hydroxy-6-metoxy-1,4-benzoquinol methylase